MDHHVILFVSSLAPHQAPDAVVDIARQARRNNQRGDITGLLVFDGEHFGQWMEGPEATVTAAAELMKTDPRHEHMEILYSAPTAEPRRFPSWRLGYLVLDLKQYGLKSLRGKRGPAAIESFRFMLPALDMAVGEAMPAKLARS